MKAASAVTLAALSACQGLEQVASTAEVGYGHAWGDAHWSATHNDARGAIEDAESDAVWLSVRPLAWLEQPRAIRIVGGADGVAPWEGVPPGAGKASAADVPPTPTTEPDSEGAIPAWVEWAGAIALALAGAGGARMVVVKRKRS